MIVPMKKLYVILQEKDAPPALETLREIGIVHVEHEKAPSGTHIDQLKEEIKLLENALGFMIREGEENHAAAQRKGTDALSQAEELLDLILLKDKLSEQISKRRSEINFWKPWGSFDPRGIQELIRQGMFLQLYEIPVNGLKKIPPQMILEVIAVKSGIARCAVVSREKMDLPFSMVAPPAISLNAMESLQEEDLKQLSALQKKIKDFYVYEESFQEALKERRAHLRFQEVLEGMGAEERLVYLKGFAPAEMTDALRKKARENQWGLLIEDPSSEDRVPTLIRNPKWVDIIKPMFGVMNILPGYQEKDISLFFLLFFSIFFGILVGDSGYGLIFLAAGFFARLKFGRRMRDKSPIRLVYVLGSAAVVWGVLTGTFFGTALFQGVFKPVLPWLTDTRNLQIVCFTIGAVHLTIAHLWRLVVKIPDLTGMLSEVGWIAILWGAYFLANMMIVGSDVLGSGKYLLIAVGAVAVVVDIVKQAKEVFVSLILFIFSVIGAFTDVVSYIRLFAVGVAGVAVADAFNRMALEVGFHNIFTALAAGLILIFVHLFLNLALCVLGVLVHGVRLNVLEFSSHLNMEWSGIKYDPFKRGEP